MQYTKPTDKASQMMRDAAMGGGGPWAHCSCGKDHSVDNEDLDCLHYSELDGQIFVDDCEGCQKKLFKYENFIWNNRDTIRRYLKTRIDQEKAWADQEDILNKLAGI